MPGIGARPQRNGAQELARHGAVLPPRRRSRAGDCDNGAARTGTRRCRARDLRHVRDSEQRDPDRRLCTAVRWSFDRSNDLTQLTLGVDRDSEIVAFDFDERDPGMLEMLRLSVTGAKRNHRHVGICGEAPANYPEIAQFLARLGIDSISVTAASLLHTITAVYEAEQTASARPVAAQ